VKDRARPRLCENCLVDEAALLTILTLSMSVG
jgi:hypothetical protein